MSSRKKRSQSSSLVKDGKMFAWNIEEYSEKNVNKSNVKKQKKNKKKTTSK